VFLQRLALRFLGQGDIACGTCPTCAERLQAFKEIDIPDPLPYTQFM